MIDQPNDYLTTLRELVGKVDGPEPAVERIDDTIVRLWSEVIGDTGTRPGEVPPAMLQLWEMPGYRMDRGVYAGVRADALTLLDRAGFTGSAAVEATRDHARCLRIGEPIWLTYIVDDVSDLRSTRLGDGHYISWTTTYLDRSGDLVATARLQLLKYRPQGSDAR